MNVALIQYGWNNMFHNDERREEGFSMLASGLHDLSLCSEGEVIDEAAASRSEINVPRSLLKWAEGGKDYKIKK